MAVLKKVLAFLLGDKKGRKFLGYTIGIVLFIALLPVIAMYGLFGWMSSGDAAGIIGYDAVYEKLPTEIREQIDANSAQLDMIEIVFRENGLTDEDITKAKLIYTVPTEQERMPVSISRGLWKITSRRLSTHRPMLTILQPVRELNASVLTGCFFQGMNRLSFPRCLKN